MSVKGLAGKISVVTGASRGIGRAIAIALADEGSHVVINYLTRQEAAKDVLRDIEKRGGSAEIMGFNISSLQEVQRAFEEIVKKHGRIDILVNNAGIIRDNLFALMKEEEWDEVINTNLKGVFNCTKAVIRTMIKQKSGRIINISSVVGVMGNPGQANYCASKAGIIGFSKALARELGSRNITVNVVAPGFIETEMTAGLSEGIRNEMLKRIPLGRFGKPEDVASVVCFLAKDAASYITGQVIHVNGGMF